MHCNSQCKKQSTQRPCVFVLRPAVCEVIFRWKLAFQSHDLRCWTYTSWHVLFARKYPFLLVALSMHQNLHILSETPAVSTFSTRLMFACAGFRLENLPVWSRLWWYHQSKVLYYIILYRYNIITHTMCRRAMLRLSLWLSCVACVSCTYASPRCRECWVSIAPVSHCTSQWIGPQHRHGGPVIGRSDPGREPVDQVL